ncbi:hypothetical protein [Corynebacterium liangguodongii]|uniref:hypothetical protein n=1 Tax=Corynebacterium liangguodongii TaxID=2079535 RepID=UPI001304AA69|nr:hypothetical protein [Corynebacterium liangguodongii]
MEPNVTNSDIQFKLDTLQWAQLSSGDTVTGELLDFIKTIGGLSKNIADMLSVAAKYL